MGTTIVIIVISIIVLALFVLAFALLRTASFARPIQSAPEVETLPVDGAAAAGHLADLLRCETISGEPGDPPPHEALQALHACIKELYPRVHTQLSRETVNEYSLLYTWQGENPDLAPVLFAAHQDVVPAVAEKWQKPPFSGAIEDGFVWGRGALDIKNQMMAVLESVEALLAAGYRPQRTVYLAFGHDEEIGGLNGARAIAALLKERGIDLWAVLDEGGTVVQGVLPGVASPVALVGVAEKGYLTIELTVEATPGHSSTPPDHSAIGILAAGIQRLENAPLPSRLDMVRPMFQAIGPAAPFMQQVAFANTWLLGGVVRKTLLSRPTTAATVRTTTAVTMIQAGVKDNVLPSQARAVVNFRLMPGDSIADVCEHARRAINDKRVQLRAIEDHAWEASPVSTTDGLAYDMLEKAILASFGSMPVAPYLVMGATDARYYSTICPNAYRFTPVLLDPVDLARIHGDDERISLEAVERMLIFFQHIIKAWTGAPTE